MVSEMVLSSEGLAADITRVGALVRVGSLVDQQIIGLGEMATTVFTYKLFLLPEIIRE